MRLRCCEATAEERGAGNPHATFCGNRRRATASGDPVITAHLLPTQPRAAAELLGRVIRLDENVFERSDDSDGVIGDAIGEAVADSGRAWAAVSARDPKA